MYTLIKINFPLSYREISIPGCPQTPGHTANKPPTPSRALTAVPPARVLVHNNVSGIVVIYATFYRQIAFYNPTTTTTTPPRPGVFYEKRDAYIYSHTHTHEYRRTYRYYDIMCGSCGFYTTRVHELQLYHNNQLADNTTTAAITAYLS